MYKKWLVTAHIAGSRIWTVASVLFNSVCFWYDSWQWYRVEEGSSAKTERIIHSECFVTSELQWLHQQIWRASVSLATSRFSCGK